jgi:hypothetical protein
VPEEGLVLDPVEVATPDRGELDLHAADDSILVRFEGVDWPTFEPELFMVQRSVGERAIDSRLPNRTVTVPLMIGARGDFSASRHALEAKAARINEEGGWLRRSLKDGKKLFGDVEKATLKFGGEIDQAISDLDANAQLTLEVSEFYGEPVETAPVKSTNGEAIVTVPTVGGNLPARTSLIVEDEAGANHLGLKYGYRYRPPDAATTAALSYKATALDPLDIAAEVVLAGALGGKAIRHNSLATDWTPVLGTNLAGSSFLTHKGLYRVEARVYSTSGEPIQGRFVYDVGDLVGASPLDPLWIPDNRKTFYTLDFGEINLEDNPIGAHRWQGAFQFRGEYGGENIYIDRVRFWPVTHGHGVLFTTPNVDQGLADYKARDEFNQSAGALSGKALPDGSGSWVTSGSTKGDFECAGILKRYLQRTAKEGGEEFGRFAEAPGGSLPLVALQIDFEWSALSEALISGFNDKNPGSPALWAEMPIGEDGKLNLFGNRVDYDWQAGTRYTLTLLFNGTGQYALGYVNGELVAITTSGLPATLPMKLVDHCVAAALTRIYDNFLAWVPNLEAVILANQLIELTEAGCYRSSSDGQGYGKIEPIGDLPRLPASGDEQREVEIMIATSPGDYHEIPDSSFQNFSVQTLTRPSRIFVP